MTAFGQNSMALLFYANRASVAPRARHPLWGSTLIRQWVHLLPSTHRSLPSTSFAVDVSRLLCVVSELSVRHTWDLRVHTCPNNTATIATAGDFVVVSARSSGRLHCNLAPPKKTCIALAMRLLTRKQHHGDAGHLPKVCWQPSLPWLNGSDILDN